MNSEKRANATLFDATITSDAGEKVCLKKGLIAHNFPSESKLNEFLLAVDKIY